MSDDPITAITMPKWGLSMIEGTVMEWLVEEGAELKLGDEIMEIETEKIANTFEALDAGLLRRKVAQAEEVLPIGALLGVLAPHAISDAEVDAYIAEFQENYVPPEPAEEDADGGFDTVEVAGYRLRYSKMGDADATIILIHGFGGDAERWLFTQQPLAEKASVYALDLPGHGASTKAIADGSVAALAGVVIGFMDALGIESARLIGHSLGGAIAIQAAIDNGDRVESLALIAPAGLGAEINAAYINGFITAESRKEMKPLLQQLVADPSLINRALINDMLQFKRIDGVTEALSAIAAGFIEGGTQSTDLRDGLAGLSIPVKVIWGSEDKIIPPSHAEGLPESISVEILEGFGHLVQLEAASQVNHLLA
ncbi:MAG: acetoin dehydrogenase dihydrolipoyllysine-residue acetyltransferase subunit [Gammaproteobacteria bacterium]|nr:acetoin dehydrogenase dihydrolipoyllysine-residue acetyltransferase subunit [Gammaproteobacteria bacterium]